MKQEKRTIPFSLFFFLILFLFHLPFEVSGLTRIRVMSTSLPRDTTDPSEFAKEFLTNKFKPCTIFHPICPQRDHYMPSGKYRSRTFTRKRTRLPGKKNVIHYARRKPEFAHCKNCGGLLAGIPNARDSRIGKIPKNRKRPERPYGGNLCPSCLKLKVRAAIVAPTVQ
jgi:large subunit ribosomal protein L34e